MRHILIIAFIVSVFSSFSQARKKTAPFSIRGTIGIPRTIASQMFRTAFNGVYEASISGNAKITDHLFVGLGYQNTHFQNNKNVFAYKQFYDPSTGKPTGNSLSYNTRLDCHAGFLKIGYDYFFAKGFVTYALNTGAMFGFYKNVNNDTSPDNQPYVSQSFTTPYVEPEISVNFFTDGRLTFSMLMSYGIMFKRFDPKAPRFAQFQEMKDASNNAPMSWLNFGFGFGFLLGKLK